MKLMKRLTSSALGLALVAGASNSLACEPDGYIGMMTVFGGNFTVRNCQLAQGQLIAISSNTALYSILGNTYGGDGRTSFALPDTRGRAVIGAGNGPGLSSIQLGQKGGRESVTLTVDNLAPHTHSATTTVTATGTAHGTSSTVSAESPSGAIWGAGDRDNLYGSGTPNVTMSPSAVSVAATASTTVNSTGGGTPVNIRTPYIGMNWMIQTVGVFPSRN